jgi:hypothetical protein
MKKDENETGDYHALNSKIWKLIETNLKTDDRGRIYAGREFIGKESKVFVSDENIEPETCKKYIILPKSRWFEVRRVRDRGGKEAGKPLEVQKTGDIWTGHKDKFVKVYVKNN